MPLDQFNQFMQSTPNPSQMRQPNFPTPNFGGGMMSPAVNPNFMAAGQQNPAIFNDPSLEGEGGFADMMDGLGKAFGSFSKAIKTPGFLPTFLGTISQSIGGENTWQKQLGGAMANIGQNIGQQNVMQKMMSGQPISQTESMFATPQMNQSVFNMMNEAARTGAYTGLAGAQAGGIAPWQEQFGKERGVAETKAAADMYESQMKTLSKLLNPPTTFRAPVGKGIEAEYAWRLDPTTGQYNYEEIGRGQTRGFEREGGLTPGENLGQSRFHFGVYKQAINEAMSDPRTLQYGKIRQNPMTGEFSIDYTDPVEGPKMFNEVLKEKLGGYVRNPNINLPESYLNMIPENNQQLTAEWPEEEGSGKNFFQKLFSF